MNTTGINYNLDRARIKKLLSIGLFASILTGIGDFLLGFAEQLPAATIATSIIAGAPNLSDWQLIAGSLLGGLCNSDFFGIGEIHGRLIRCGTCGNSGRCDYLDVGSKNELAAGNETVTDEAGFLVSRRKGHSPREEGL